MKKLSLSLDALQVTSFETADTIPATRGTVQGNAATKNCDPSFVMDCSNAHCVTIANDTCNCTGIDCEYTMALTCAGCPSGGLATCTA